MSPVPVSHWPVPPLTCGTLAHAPFICSSLACRADWESAAPSRRRTLGVSWGCPAAVWGPPTPNPTQISWKPLILENWSIFPVLCEYVDWPYVAQVRFWRPKRPHLKKRLAIWQSSLSWDNKSWTFQKNTCIILFTFYRSKSGTLVQKTVFWGCFGPSVR